MKILLSQPRGFCAGVSRAVAVVEHVLKIEAHPVFVRHEVVHNQFVVNNLRKKGAIFVEELNEVPNNATVIFSAHGVSQSVKDEANARNLKVYDATCPLVTKVHLEVQKSSIKGFNCVLIGHKGHPEVEGTLGQYLSSLGNIYLVETIDDVENLVINDENNLIYVTQTTLSLDETKDIISTLQKRFPTIIAPKKADICYATQNRQNAVKKLSKRSDVVLIVGSANSSNSNRLRELAEKQGVPAYLIDGPDDICRHWFQNKKIVGLSAGASAPEALVAKVISHLQNLVSCSDIEVLEGVIEDIHFALPKLLRDRLEKNKVKDNVKRC